jgi:hypothetical protein
MTAAQHAVHAVHLAGAVVTAVVILRAMRRRPWLAAEADRHWIATWLTVCAVAMAWPVTAPAAWWLRCWWQGVQAHPEVLAYAARRDRPPLDPPADTLHHATGAREFLADIPTQRGGEER